MLKKQQPPQLDMESLENPQTSNKNNIFASLKVKLKSVESNRPWRGNNEQPITPKSPSKSPAIMLKKGRKTRQPEEDYPKRGSTPTRVCDSLGKPLSELQQARIKSLQKDLLQLVKEGERGGRIKILKRKDTECISMPGHGTIRLARLPPSGQ
eukprot:213357-Rhodomonas_salina.2